MEATLQQHRNTLREKLHAYPHLLVAYSGGVDSAYLAWEAHQVFGPKMLAVIADSPSLPRQQLTAAIMFAEAHGMPLRVVSTNELARPAYVQNAPDRCFHCKDELFSVMRSIASETGFHAVAYGRNRDDSRDFRPGQSAADTYRVLAPLAEAGLGKEEIRALAKACKLTVWDKPASACLASRIEYGRPVTTDALRQVEVSEDFLSRLGFRQYRVRHHGGLARIEISQEELLKALSPEVFQRIVVGLREAGFTYITLDMEGYRSGSMNAVLSVESLLTARIVPHAS